MSDTTKRKGPRVVAQRREVHPEDATLVLGRDTENPVRLGLWNHQIVLF